MEWQGIEVKGSRGRGRRWQSGGLGQRGKLGGRNQNKNRRLMQHASTVHPLKPQV